MKKTTAYSLFIALCLSMSLLSCGGGSTSPGRDRIELLSASLYAGPFFSIEVEGDYAYCGAAGSFQIISLADRQNPVFVGGVSVPDIIHDVAISGNHAYLAAREHGVVICNISNPDRPAIVGQWDFAWDRYAKVFEVCVSGSHVIAGAGQEGLQIIDVSNPAEPVRVGYYIGNGAYCPDFYVSGSFAYVHERDSISIVDFSDPANPVRVGRFGGDSYHFDGSGTKLYTTGVGAGSFLEVYDISDPLDPQLLGTLEGPFARFLAYEDYIYAIEAPYPSDADVMIIDINDPANPVLAGVYTTPEQAFYVMAKEGYLFTADHRMGTAGRLHIADITDPSSPANVAEFAPDNGATDVFVYDNYAYVVTGRGLHISDVNDVYNPVNLGYFEIGGFRSVIEAAGDRMFVVNRDSSGLRIYNVSDKTNPTLIGTFGHDNESGYRDLDVEGDYGYATAGLSGLDIVDISNPSQPVLVSHIDTVYSVFVFGNYCYAGRLGPKIGIYDVADPSNPMMLGEYEGSAGFGSPYDIIVLNQIAYFPVHYGGLQMVDVSDPANPTLVGTYGEMLSDETGFSVSGDRAYIPMIASGLHIIDVSNPANPVLDAIIESGYYTHGVFAIDDIIYVADGSSFKIYRYNY